MARNQFEDSLRAVLEGGLQGYQAGRAGQQNIEQALMMEKIKNVISPGEYKPRTMSEALDFERAKAGIVKPKELLAEQKTNLQISDLQQKQEDIQKQKEFATESVKNSTLDALDTIKNVKSGINYFGMTGALPSLPATPRAKWEANVNKLLSGRIVQIMTEMKQASKTGATGFGQLSDKEGKILREASTALKKTLSPKDATEILDKMELSLQKVLGNQSPGNDVSSKASSYLQSRGLSGNAAQVDAFLQKNPEFK